jgi:DNA-binding LacI/PurR family transcriptional regulator
MARALAEGKSSMVGMVLPNITNPFYPEFIRVAERVARQRKFFLMVCNTDEQPEIGLAYLRQISGTLADGVLILHAGIGAKEILEYGGRRAPIVLASEETVDFADTISHVIVNFRQAGHIAAQHLLELGHKRIGVIVGGGLDGCQLLRLEGYKDALAEAGLTYDENDTVFVRDSIEGGYQATASLLERDIRSLRPSSPRMTSWRSAHRNCSWIAISVSRTRSPSSASPTSSWRSRYARR